MKESVRESMIYGYMLEPDYSYIQEFSLSDIILGIKRAIYNILEKIENLIKKAKDSSIKTSLLKFIDKFKKLFKDCDNIKNINDVNNISEKTKEAKKELEDTITRFKPTSDDIIDKDDLQKSFDSLDNSWENFEKHKNQALNNIDQRHKVFNAHLKAAYDQMVSDYPKPFDSGNAEKMKELDDRLNKLLED